MTSIVRMEIVNGIDSGRTYALHIISIPEHHDLLGREKFPQLQNKAAQDA